MKEDKFTRINAFTGAKKHWDDDKWANSQMAAEEIQRINKSLIRKSILIGGFFFLSLLISAVKYCSFYHLLITALISFPVHAIWLIIIFIIHIHKLNKLK